MNEIRGWFSSLSSLWEWEDDKSVSREMQEMDAYTYEPILPEIVSNGIQLKSASQEKKGIVSHLYFGLDEGKPYIKVVHSITNNMNNQDMTKEETFMITSCYAESGRGAWIVEYQCKNGIKFVFSRIFKYIETCVIKNGKVVKFYTIDVKKEPRFTLFNEKDVKSELRDDLRDLYKFEELFEHAY